MPERRCCEVKCRFRQNFFFLDRSGLRDACPVHPDSDWKDVVYLKPTRQGIIKTGERTELVSETGPAEPEKIQDGVEYNNEILDTDVPDSNSLGGPSTFTEVFRHP